MAQFKSERTLKASPAPSEGGVKEQQKIPSSLIMRGWNFCFYFPPLEGLREAYFGEGWGEAVCAFSIW